MSIAIRIAAAAGLAAAAALGATTAQAQDEPTRGQAELAEMLEGRVAGEPQSCLRSRLGGSESSTIIDGTAIVFRRGSTIWVNIPQRPETLDDNDILVTEIFGSQLCRLDRTYTIDRTSRFFSGPVFLTDFVPYERVSDSD